MPKKNKKNRNRPRGGISAYLRKPAVQLGILALVALIVYLIASSAGGVGAPAAPASANTVNAQQAYEMYQRENVFVLDVREQAEWDEYHIPNTTLIPLGELPDRLSEIPTDKEILVVCRSGNRSQEGRDILSQAGFNAVSMDGGLKEWYAQGYPLEGAPAQ